MFKPHTCITCAAQISLALCVLLMVNFTHASDKRLTITGSSTVAPLVLEIAKRFEALHPTKRINVQTGGSSRGINDTLTGLADIGMVSRELKSTEKSIMSFLIAMDGIGIIIHKKNTVTALSNQEILAIYKGEIKNWHEVGGIDLPITVVNKAEGRSTLELFLHYFKLKNSAIKPHVVIGDNQQGIKTVSGNPGAIGYVSIGSAEYEEARGTPIKMLPLNKQAASVESVAKGVYPLSRQLNLVVKKAPTGLVKTFLAFAQSSEVNDLIEAQFFVAP